MKRSIRKEGRTNVITGTEPIRKKASTPMPKIFKILYIVSMYIRIVPIITSIHAASRVLGQSKMAKKTAAAPRASWLIIYAVCPSIRTVSSLIKKISSLEKAVCMETSFFCSDIYDIMA
jgi:hypothetical protein